MSKNLLIVSASPRKGGNSDLLCDEFMRGARAAGHTAEKIRLSEKKINYCTGCCACIGNQGACVQQDDMNDIFKKILDAHILVLATPVYFHAMNAQMKTFIDRTCPIYAMVRNKEVYYIVAAAGGQMPVGRAVNSLQVYTNCLGGTKERGVISVTGIWDAGLVKGTQAMDQAYTMGENA
ncbi:MAG: flavodoxin family protein [Desulfobacter sp.]|nr:MAG: flavodoxin family protein [Desulfobacter sp.]